MGLQHAIQFTGCFFMGCILLPAIPKQSGVASFALLKTNSFKRTGGHAVKSWATCYNSKSERNACLYCRMATLLLDYFYFDNLGILKGNASLFLWFSFQDSMNVHLISFLPFFFLGKTKKSFTTPITIKPVVGKSRYLLW